MRGHNYDSYIISAPVEVNGDTVYVGALVIKDTKQRYKLHEVLTASESGVPLFNRSPPARVPVFRSATIRRSGSRKVPLLVLLYPQKSRKSTR